MYMKPRHHCQFATDICIRAARGKNPDLQFQGSRYYRLRYQETINTKEANKV